MITRKVAVIGIGVLILSAIAMTAHPKIRWRVALITTKLLGQRPELSWEALLRDLRPQSHRNPYQTAQNPRISAEDLSAGEDMFRAQCSDCHGLGGKGGLAPDLALGGFRHGASDLGLFETIRDGIPGTSMGRAGLPDTAVWQLVTYIRSLASGHLSTDTTALKRPSSNVSLAPIRVTQAQLLRASEEPANWLTYSGSYSGRRYSTLSQIDKAGVRDLAVKWIFQMPTQWRIVQSTPLVVDGIMFVTEPPSNAYALDAQTGRMLWHYERTLPEYIAPCCGEVNRGAAMLDRRLLLGTIDAHLVALDASTGSVLWDVEVADYRLGYSITGVPLIANNLVVVGIAGSVFGIRGFLDAYDPETGKRVWRFYTIPGPGEPGNETWAGDSWKTGGGATWLTGSFDPDLNLIYWGVSNPAPVYHGATREGDNLYANSVIAVDAGSGMLKWHFQFTPHDVHDWDAAQIPVLATLFLGDSERDVLLWANRNGHFYVLDRASGEFLLARPFARQTWADGIDDTGRPILRENLAPTADGTFLYPGPWGATNWWSPSFSPATGLLYVPVVEWGAVYFSEPGNLVHVPGRRIWGSAYQVVPGDNPRKFIRALAHESGNVVWEHEFSPGPRSQSMSGILSTGGGLVFSGAPDGRFVALDAHTGKRLWERPLGGDIIAAPITYIAGGQQHIAIAAGRSIVAFALHR